MAKKRTYTVALTDRHRDSIRRFSAFYGISEGAVVRLLITRILDGACEDVTDPLECCRVQFIQGCETLAELESHEPQPAESIGVSDEGGVD